VAKRRPKEVIVARMADGSYQVLARDCSCKAHIGPHWLHMNDHDRRANSKRLKDLDLTYCYTDPIGSVPPMQLDWLRHCLLSVAAAEMRRLAEKRREMEARGVVEIYRGREARRVKALHIDGDVAAYYRLGGGREGRRKKAR